MSLVFCLFLYVDVRRGVAHAAMRTIARAECTVSFVDGRFFSMAQG